MYRIPGGQKALLRISVVTGRTSKYTDAFVGERVCMLEGKTTRSSYRWMLYHPIVLIWLHLNHTGKERDHWAPFKILSSANSILSETILRFPVLGSVAHRLWKFHQWYTWNGWPWYPFSLCLSEDNKISYNTFYPKGLYYRLYVNRMIMKKSKLVFLWTTANKKRKDLGLGISRLKTELTL